MEKVFKRWIALLLLVCCLPAMPIFTARGAEEEKDSQSKEYAFLYQLQILPEDFEITKIVTRGEFAFMVNRILYENVAYAQVTDEGMFQDVSTSHKYYNEIKALKGLGVISGTGDNRYLPDNSISSRDGLAILIKALSYHYSAQAKGGYPTRYLAVAGELGLIKGLSLSGDLSGIDAVKMIYRSLFVDSVNIDSIWNGEVSFSINHGKTVLSEYLKITQYDGVIYNDRFSSLDGSVLLKDNHILIKDFKTGEEALLLVKDAKIYDYFGSRLEIFVKENANEEKEIIFFLPHEHSNSMTLKGSQVVSFTDSFIEYELTKEDLRTQKLKHSMQKPPLVLINGIRRIDYSAKDFMKSNVLITWIDHDGDKNAEVILVYDFNGALVVDSVREDFIADRSEAGNHLKLDEETARYRIFNSGKIKELKDLRKNDVVLYAKASQLVDGKEQYYLFATREIASGDLTSKENNELVIGGKNYPVTQALLSSISSLKFENMKGYLDGLGRIAYIEKGSSDRNYAFVLQAAITGDVIDPQGMARLFTAEGTVETLTLSEKVKMNQEETKADLTNLVNRLKNTTEDLIVYSLNQAGEIDRVMFAQDFDTEEKNNQDRFVYVKSVTTRAAYSGHSFGGMDVRNAICFSINSSYDNTGKGCEIFTMKTNQYYGGMKFYDLGYNGAVGAVLMKGSSSTGSFQSEPKEVYVVDSITEAISKDGDVLRKIYYYNQGKKGSVLANLDATHLALGSYKCESILELKFGDLITFETGISGYMERFSLLYSGELAQWSEDGNIYQSTWGGTGTAKDIALFQGTLRFKNSEKIVIQLNGPTLVLHPLYRSGSDKAYLINRADKKIRVVSLDELQATDFYQNIPGATIITQSTRHQLKEVIIYE